MGMKFDRLVLDLLQFIRRFLWWQDAKETQQPFESIKDIHIPHRGVLQYIQGRDTPRAVSTWRFCPKSDTSYYVSLAERPNDTHVYLDHHAMLPEFREKSHDTTIKARYQIGRPTHTITILRASHHVNELGNFDVEYIAHRDLDFSKGPEQSYYAIGTRAKKAARFVALIVALYSIPDDRWLWEREIDQIYYRVTRHGTPIKNTYAYRKFGE